MPDLSNGVPFLDLTQQFEMIKDEWFSAIRDTGVTGKFILGPNVSAFEEEFAAYIGTRYAVAVANGTEALALSLRAIDIGRGDEVITTPYTFFSTAEVISQVGATPVFVDIEADSFNIDSAQIAQRVTPNTRAIIPVHLFGYPADMSEIMTVAEEHGLVVIEDCAQACGAEYANHRAGALGFTGCFSFYPTKILGCYGDGGIITTNDERTAEKILKLRNHGATAPFVHEWIGHNSRLDEIQAALLRIKLRKIDKALEERARIATYYNDALSAMDVGLPRTPMNGRHAFNLYTLRFRQRDAVREYLQKEGIGCSVCYPVPLHLQSVYSQLAYARGDLPVSEQAADECLSIPIYPEMHSKQIDRVCQVIQQALG